MFSLQILIKHFSIKQIIQPVFEFKPENYLSVHDDSMEC